MEARDLGQVVPVLPPLERLEKGFRERAAEPERLSDGPHLRPELRLDPRELRKVEARRLDGDVVERRLERGARRSGDVVRQLVERVADRQQSRELGDRKARCLRGERRGARDARVHLDDHQPAGRRLVRELDVRAAGRHARRCARRRRPLRAAAGTPSSGNVCCGATVHESPVWTPIGSRFSIEQMTTQLPARSTITSSSNSCQPSTDRSTRACWIGLVRRP